MSRRVYSALLILLAPLLWGVMRLRARKTKQSWEIFSRERFGWAGSGESVSAGKSTPAPSDDLTRREHPAQRPPLVWVHAVSLGETRASQSLVMGLLAAGYHVLLTHMTATGRAEGARLYSGEIAAGQLSQSWVPYDFPGATRRFFELHRPALGILIEREIWPNLVHACAARSIPLALVSARFSPSALKQGRRMSGLLKQSLAAIDPILCQTQGDADRLALAGARAPQVAGNLKFDVSVAHSVPEEIKQIRQADARKVIALASTREGEDALFIDALRAQHAMLDPAIGPVLTLLVPRHPQRFDSAAETARRAGLNVCRRSQTGWRVPVAADVMIGDSLGEMPQYLGLADVAIIGGSFEPLGGQNFIEACALGVPVIVGPSTYNFEPAAQDAIEAGAVLRARDAAHAMTLAHELLGDARARAAMSRAGREWVAGHVGATARVLAALPLPPIKAVAARGVSG